MQLSKRLSAVAEFVTPGGCLVDVGTDHGYVPIALLEQKKISSAIAMDVNRGPLERAREHIAQYQMGDYIETRLRAGEGDSLLIAGMGGGLTIRILSEGEPLLSGFRELILEPQSDIDRVRAWLLEHGFFLAQENFVEEDGKYYPMMRAELIHDFEDRSGQCKDHPWKTFQYFYGDVEKQRSPEVLRNFLIHEQEKSSTIMERLHENGREVSDRMKELQEQMNLIRETLEALDGR